MIGENYGVLLTVALFGIFLLLLVGRFLVIKLFPLLRSQGSTAGNGDTIRVLETCNIGFDRRLMLFTCPFGQGLVLFSPRGDSVHLFKQSVTDAPPPYPLS